MGKERKPPQNAEELLERYAAGERDFRGAKLNRANLYDAVLAKSQLNAADLTAADLRGANLAEAGLYGADLRGARLSSANISNAGLIDANLCDARLDDTRAHTTDFRRARLRRANLCRADLVEASFGEADLYGADFGGAYLGFVNMVDTEIGDANFGGVQLAGTFLHGVDLTSLCDADPPVVHSGPSYIDHRSVVLSLRSRKLKEFLQRTGMPEVFVEYMVECAKAMDGSLIKKLLQSTFISYGGPDEPLARRLYEALHRNGVTTFFFPEHAKPGQRIGRVVRENVESYDRILLLCSRASLGRPGVLYEIEETFERERRGGAAEYLIPIELDDCLRENGAVLRKDLVRVLRDRVCADFRGAQEDEEVFQAGLRKLIAALRPPDLAMWRPQGSTKPTDS